MLYLYGEASPILKLAIDNALRDDKTLQKEIDILQRAKKQMENLQKSGSASPSKKTVDAILNYSRKTTPKKPNK